MENIKTSLFPKNIAVGWLYFYIHFITEITCFYFLASVAKESFVVWLIPFVYDALAFVPQGIIGNFSDKHPKLNIGLVGIVLLFLAILLKFFFKINPFVCLLFLTIGNCIMHISGAEDTLRLSDGRLSHPAIFVAGGSFGVIIGKLLANINLSFLPILFLILTMIPFLLLAKTYRTETSNNKESCKNFNYANLNIAPFLVILLATFVVIVRGYIGYGIPTSWNKTVVQNIIFFFTMGIGKALRRNFV